MYSSECRGAQRRKSERFVRPLDRRKNAKDFYRGMAEWAKAPPWKGGEGKSSVGSNPTPSAT